MIDKLDWANKKDYNENKEILKRLPKSAFKQLEAFARKKHNDLYVKYKKDWLADPGIGASDDGWDDIRAEVVGRGKDFYNNITVKKLQDMADRLDYKENFLYSFLTDFAKGGSTYSDGGEVSQSVVDAIFDPNESNGKITTSLGNKYKEGLSDLISNKNFE